MKVLAASQKLAPQSAKVDCDSFQIVETVPEIVEKYRKWVSEDKYMILSRVKMKKYKIRDSRKNKPIIVEFPIESDYFALKCSKRGNDVYRQRVYRRFKGLASLVEKKSFFNPKDRKQNKKTRALFVTLTYDTKRCSFDHAWKNIGIEFNRFMSHVRKKFGKVSSCRVFEAFANGHPHIHCVLLFEEKEFKVFIKTKHNSNHKTQQTTLKGEIINEYVYYCLGFVPADVVKLKKEIRFSQLNNEQIKSIECFIQEKKSHWN